MSQFLWGAATSAHQVEGNNIHSDWWAWERLTPGIIPSGRAADHYQRYAEDIALARALGHTAHRLSLEWARLEPKRGQWDREAAAHYRTVLQEVKKAGMAVFVTLHHFTNPQWFAARGGWERADSPALFTQHVRRAAQTFGDLVDFWITINEPIVWAQQAYWTRRWPPQRHSAWRMLRVIRRLAAGHRSAYRALKGVREDIPVGIAKHFIAYEPIDSRRRMDHQYAALMRWWFNHRFFSLTGPTHDFIGVNYYFTSRVGWRGVRPYRQSWRGAVSDLGWPIYPEGLTQVLLEAARYRRPVYVTENGLADAADTQRADYIREHTTAVRAAQRQGADVRGYLYWSLLDNFEWDFGFAPRFGLAEVDYATMQRHTRPSATAYQKIIEMTE
ncbi:MAG: glycosyl transferase [Candidatus Andersenbacteria bacterium CG10_big_fil_rev_8_21_14_0_10_54_11]|uniref:Glycosyl transferase n=1 Tax=Candidatus Andersenbacteria bacterium CG10_big_fil_rev_8_21_14_0_10_54_11 TaxID=1974485 RepID=A0A2M6X0B4_9BACT|nr:MAG: glycosyl transferase [Candidatus Andersenbacteria bacterium CG10_big_fil_rev_8_21_14_0_10_54_11]